MYIRDLFSVRYCSFPSILFLFGVLVALSKEFKEGLPMELLHADDLVLMVETEEGIVTRKVK